MAVSTGSFTVGTAADYGTWQAAFADIVNGSLSGDLTFTQISDTTETARSIPPGSINLNGHNLTFQSDTPHEGNPTAGWWININYAMTDDAFELTVTGASGLLEVKDLKFKRLSTAGAAAQSMFSCSGGATGPSIHLHDLLLDFNGQGAGTGLTAARTGNNPTVHIWNCVIWGGGDNGILVAWIPKDLCRVENNVVRETDTQCFNVSGDATYGGHFYNNLAVPASGAGYPASSGGIAASNNGTSLGAVETGGANNVVDVVEADEFVSLDDTNSDFMKVKAGRLDTEGVTPTIADNDFGNRGNARPGADAAVSIGADELEVAGGPGPRSMVVMT